MLSTTGNHTPVALEGLCVPQNSAEWKENWPWSQTEPALHPALTGSPGTSYLMSLNSGSIPTSQRVSRLVVLRVICDIVQSLAIFLDSATAVNTAPITTCNYFISLYFYFAVVIVSNQSKNPGSTD